MFYEHLSHRGSNALCLNNVGMYLGEDELEKHFCYTSLVLLMDSCDVTTAMTSILTGTLLQTVSHTPVIFRRLIGKRI